MLNRACSAELHSKEAGTLDQQELNELQEGECKALHLERNNTRLQRRLGTDWLQRALELQWMPSCELAVHSHCKQHKLHMDCVRDNVVSSPRQEPLFDIGQII